MIKQFGAPDTNRTCDPLLRREMLYPLSYGGTAAGLETGLRTGASLQRDCSGE